MQRSLTYEWGENVSLGTAAQIGLVHQLLMIMVINREKQVEIGWHE
jgi:hypothetical protein